MPLHVQEEIIMEFLSNQWNSEPKVNASNLLVTTLFKSIIGVPGLPHGKRVKGG